MSPVAAPPSLEEFPVLAERIEQAVREDDETGAHDGITDLFSAVTEAASDRDLDAIAQYGSRVSKLRRRIERLELERAAAESVLRQLEKLIATLERARASVFTAAVAERSRTEVSTLRERIEALMAKHESVRPRELAAALGVDTTQVSRALRELEAEGKAQPTSPPVGANDRRSRWWRIRGDHPSYARVVSAQRRRGMTVVRVEVEGDARFVAVVNAHSRVALVDVRGREIQKPQIKSFVEALNSELDAEVAETT